MPHFGDDRLRGSGVVAGQISAFPIDFVGRPYNTLTLPCERVIQESRNSSGDCITQVHLEWPLNVHTRQKYKLGNNKF